MNKLISLIILVMVTALLVPGCQASETKQVSVGNLILDIPSDWQQVQEEETRDIDDELASYSHEKFYKPEFSDDEIYYLDSICVTCQDMEGYHKSIGSPYSYEPDSDYYWGWPKADYAVTSLSLLSTFWKAAQQYRFEEPVNLMINGCEAVEIQIIFTFNDVSYVASVITVFSENDLGTLIIIRRDTSEQYEEQYDWNVIRDSVRFK